MRAYHPMGALMPIRKFLKEYLEPYQLPKEQLRALLTTKDEDKHVALLEQVFAAQGVRDFAGAVRDVRTRLL